MMPGMESTLGPRGRVTITGRPLLPAFPALRLEAPDKKLACPPYSILLTHLLPQDTVIFFSFYSFPTQHHSLNSESQEQGSVVAWPKTPKSDYLPPQEVEKAEMPWVPHMRHCCLLSLMLTVIHSISPFQR